MAEKRILSIGVDEESLSRVSGHLEREEYALEMAPTPRSALSLLNEIPFDLVVLTHPQPNLVLGDFLTELRQKTSESKGAKLLLLAADMGHEELQQLQEHALEIISRDDALIGDLATRVLSGDPRIPIAVIVRLEADLPYGKSLRICQSENLSISGMLVRTEDTLPVDTKVVTNFAIPDGKDPIEAKAKVVRLTGPGEIPGIALHFERLKRKDRTRLQEFLNSPQA